MVPNDAGTEKEVRGPRQRGEETPAGKKEEEKTFVHANEVIRERKDTLSSPPKNMYNYRPQGKNSEKLFLRSKAIIFE